MKKISYKSDSTTTSRYKTTRYRFTTNNGIFRFTFNFMMRIKEICSGLTSGYPVGIFKLFFEHQQLMAQENFGKIPKGYPEAKSG